VVLVSRVVQSLCRELCLLKRDIVISNCESNTTCPQLDRQSEQDTGKKEKEWMDAKLFKDSKYERFFSDSD
jgi:hypothetical protein